MRRSRESEPSGIYYGREFADHLKKKGERRWRYVKPKGCGTLLVVVAIAQWILLAYAVAR